MPRLPVTPQGEVKRSTAVALILATVVLVIALGVTIGYMFFWQTYDRETKQEHDFKVAKTAVDANPSNAEAHVALGWSYVQLGKLDQALNQYQIALKLDPKNAAARYNIDLIKIQRRDLQGAKADLENLVKENPKYWAARATLGYLYREMGDYKLAVEQLETVNAFQPGNVDVLYQLGLTYAKMGDKTKAKAVYLKALQYDPSAKEVQNALAALE